MSNRTIIVGSFISLIVALSLLFFGVVVPLANATNAATIQRENAHALDRMRQMRHIYGMR